ncbi:MAG: ATPase domain-containing protein [Candidatus Thermoplasmatota archaeon]
MQEAKSLMLKRKGETDGFAERFGVEIPNGSLIFMEGKEGTGKSIFCQRFCYSFLLNGHTCSYVSTQFTIKSFLRQTASVGYDMRQYLMSGKLFFISTEVTLAETKPKKTFLEALMTGKKLFDPEIIFIDSISTLLNESLNKENLIDLTSFLNRLKGSGKIIVLTANPNDWPAEIHNAFKMFTDIHYRISREAMPGVGVVHNLYIEKFNGARRKYEPMTTFSVKPNVGLSIESSGVAF